MATTFIYLIKTKSTISSFSKLLSTHVVGRGKICVSQNPNTILLALLSLTQGETPQHRDKKEKN